ncbi:MAG: 30S ribosomal protein S6 [Lentisphaerae bacterium]|nr:30S ribosomal protein S6 [Lentisphaerota bacterium]
MNKYDGLYIFAGLAKDANLDTLVGQVQGEVTRLHGAILKTEVLGRRTFSRPMHKQENGTYVRIRFELAPEHVQALIARYHLMEEVFRVQILAVDERREAVLIEQAAKFRAREAARQAAADEAAAAAGQASMAAREA